MRTNKTYLYSALIVMAGGASLQAGPALILEATPCFFQHEDNLARAVLAVVDESAKPDDLFRVEANSQTHHYALKDLPRWMGRVVVPVEVSEEPIPVRIVWERQDRAGELTLEPERRWDVYIVPHTHLDVGFTDVQEKVWAQLADNLNKVVALCEQTADGPEDSRFHWTIEATALFENFAKRHPDQVDRLVALIRSGQVELTGGWANLLTELCGSEALTRSMYSAASLAEQHNIRIDTAMLNDVPGYTWAMPTLWSQSGIRFANLRANAIRGKFVWSRPDAVPRPFRWRSPEGSEVIVWYTDSYREANYLRMGFPATGAAGVDHKMQAVLHDSLRAHLKRSVNSGYDRNVLQLRMGGDNYDAAESVCQWVRYWNDRWAYPKLRLATSRKFFHALTQDSKPIPTFQGDIPDWWADGAASSAQPTGQARLAHDHAISLQMWHAFQPEDAQSDPELLKTFDELFRNILLYCEHTWGASTKWYGVDPNQVSQQWATKKGYIDQATRDLATLDNELRPQATSEPTQIDVFNPTSWIRTDVVRLSAQGLPSAFHVTDAEGTIIPVQRDSQGAYCFLARDVPSMGQASYRIVAGSAPAVEVSSEATYQLSYDTDQGQITNVLHRPTHRSLIDPQSPYPFNGYVIERGVKQERVIPVTITKSLSPTFKTKHQAEPASSWVHHPGPVFDEWILTTQGPQASSIIQRYTAYHGLDVLDIVNTVEKIESGEVEQIYFAFPFDMHSPAVRLEIPLTSMRPGLDQLRYAATDFYSIEHWVDLSDKTGGVLWASREAPVITLGDLWPDCWSDDFTMTNGHLFSYVMTNTWFTNYRRQQGGTLTFRYRLQAYTGASDLIRAERFGDSFARPLLAQLRSSSATVPQARSFLTVEPDHVKVEAIKRAASGTGIIIRLTEPGQADALAKLTFHQPITQAHACTPAEQRQRPLKITKGEKANKADRENDRDTVEIALPRHGFVTVSVE